MAAWDNLGPQFGEFNPSSDIFGGVDSEMRFSRQSPSGEITRNSRAMANMQGRNRSEDLQMGMPTGSTTDFRAPAMHPSGDVPPDYSYKFLPAQPPNDLNGSSRFN